MCSSSSSWRSDHICQSHHGAPWNILKPWTMITPRYSSISSKWNITETCAGGHMIDQHHVKCHHGWVTWIKCGTWIKSTLQLKLNTYSPKHLPRDWIILMFGHKVYEYKTLLFLINMNCVLEWNLSPLSPDSVTPTPDPPSPHVSLSYDGFRSRKTNKSLLCPHVSL